MSRGVVILGAGGHGRVVADALRAEGRLKLEGFLDPALAPGTELFGGARVLGGDELLAALPGRGIHGAVMGVGSVGNSSNRARIFRRLVQAGLAAERVIHPRATLSPAASIGAGTTVLAGAVVNAGANVGVNCILNTGCVLEHDCRVGDHVQLAPRCVVGGDCRIGDGSHVGIGATVIQGITIGRNVLVGAGAVVTRDLPDNVVAVGCPARVLRPQPAVEL